MRTVKLTRFITFLLFLMFSSHVESAGKIDGFKVYRNNCQKCHGEDGKRTTRGKTLGAPDFTDVNWQAKQSDTEFLNAIANGKEKMPSWKGKLSPEEMIAVIKVVRSFASKKRSP